MAKSIALTVLAAVLSIVHLVHADGCTAFAPLKATNKNSSMLLPNSNHTINAPSIISDEGYLYGLLGPLNAISEGAFCPNGSTTGCYFGITPATPSITTNLGVPIGGIVTDSRTLNLTSSTITDEISSSLFDIIGKTVGVDLVFNASVSANISGYGFGLSPGQGGYAVFYPFHKCVSGVLSGCTGSGYPVDGTAVEACTPYGYGPCTSKDDSSCLDGLVTSISLSQQQAMDVNCSACDAEDAASSASGGPLSISTMGLLSAGLLALFVAII